MNQQERKHIASGFFPCDLYASGSVPNAIAQNTMIYYLHYIVIHRLSKSENCQLRLVVVYSVATHKQFP